MDGCSPRAGNLAYLALHAIRLIGAVPKVFLAGDAFY